MSTAVLHPTTILPKTLARFVWSVRREVWEHRFLLAAPVGVAVLAVVGFMAGWPFGVGEAVAKVSRGPWGGMGRAYDATTFFCIMAAFAAALIYCIDALHGERRDRSILFWKSLPVSDFQTVLAKLTVPMLVLPFLAFAAVMLASVAMLLAGSAFLALGGHDAAIIWSPSIRFSCLIYGLSVSTLWLAPLYCALLLVSVWAKHVPFLWAVLPPSLLAAVAKLIFHSQAVSDFYLYRLVGWFELALRLDKAGLPVAREPERFFTSPDLWLGLVAAALCFMAAVRLRRRSAPL